MEHLASPATKWGARARLPIVPRVDYTGLGNLYHGHSTQRLIDVNDLVRNSAGISIFVARWWFRWEAVKGLAQKWSRVGGPAGGPSSLMGLQYQTYSHQRLD